MRLSSFIKRWIWWSSYTGTESHLCCIFNPFLDPYFTCQTKEVDLMARERLIWEKNTGSLGEDDTFKLVSLQTQLKLRTPTDCWPFLLVPFSFLSSPSQQSAVLTRTCMHHACDRDNSVFQIALVMLRCIWHTAPVVKLEQRCRTSWQMPQEKQAQHHVNCWTNGCVCWQFGQLSKMSGHA